jgi:hypothetical protein
LVNLDAGLLVQVTHDETDELDRRLRGLDPAFETGAVAAGPGSPVGRRPASCVRPRPADR